ncbi:sugar nucleotide-binding protein [Paenibacillus alkalitolerans]|uniref:sugar nucleotide-binding protein n=1 Tax=Paenibacillus alkalitolerans TaxID=2799335 RepID=UPI0018F7B481|nr:sugar nucleotide-binding protein [Paenibacillus alkalitolerans]
MRVLITGAYGQLGHDLVFVLSNHYTVFALGRKQMDITNASRPAYSVLDHMAIRLNGFPDFRDWKEALINFIGEVRGTCI